MNLRLFPVLSHLPTPTASLNIIIHCGLQMTSLKVHWVAVEFYTVNTFLQQKNKIFVVSIELVTIIKESYGHAAVYGLISCYLTELLRIIFISLMTCN